jgi:hypothetical protein
VQVDPIKPTLKVPGTKRLKLDYDQPLSNFAVTFNLRHYTVAADDSFLGSIGSGFSAAQAQIDAQLKSVAEQAISLPGNIAGGIQAAGADVTSRLNALISLLDRVNQKPPEETEDEKRKKRKLILELEALHFTDWNIHILAGFESWV